MTKPETEKLCELLTRIMVVAGCRRLNHEEKMEFADAIRAIRAEGGGELERWGFPDHPRDAVTALIPRDDGYWTPWHIAMGRPSIGATPASALDALLVQQAIARLRNMGEWDGKTYDEELSAILRKIAHARSAGGKDA